LRPSGEIRPTYAENFHCIGSSCEDTCCQGWNVPVDRESFEKYRNLPDVPLSALLKASVHPTPVSEGKEVTPANFAQIRMNEANQCPLLATDGLCQVQRELGESMLSHTCSVYPRIINTVDGVQEKALSLSCPEAARLVLLHPNLLSLHRQGAAATDTDLRLGTSDPAEVIAAQEALMQKRIDHPFTPQAWFWPIRAAIIDLVGNRTYPLWQRLFLLGVFCRRLDAIAKGELARPIPDFLGDFASTVATGNLLPAMDSLPVDRPAQLDVVLRLAGMMLHRSNVRPRFVECIQAFTDGIGNGPRATLETLSAQYAVAHDRHYQPFFERHPHILENYLLNTIFRTHFPFGRSGAQANGIPDMTREFALLTAQFALMKGLLIGVAGHHRYSFSTNHVVLTFQAAAKHFEHHPEFLNQAHTLLVESGMDGARGLAILLRNTEPASATRPTVPTVQVPMPQAGR
jgi:lysine-N-methylase